MPLRLSGARVVLPLAICQALLFTTNATLITVNALAGLALAPRKGLATLPVTFWVLGGAAAAVPASLFMRWAGRRAGFSLGAALVAGAMLVCAGAIAARSFVGLCFGAFAFGVANAFGQHYRFAAAESVAPERRATAIAHVLAGGLVGGVVGPNLSRWAVDLLEPRFLGVYLVLLVFPLATLAILRGLELPGGERGGPQQARGRPLGRIARDPRFIVALAAGALGYGVMNFLMTSTPIAMGACGHGYGDAAFVISSHIVAMFAPSFFTGMLVRRWGVVKVLLAGVALNGAAVAIGAAGLAVAHFWGALVLLGVGWNFLFVGGTALLTEAHRPEEKGIAQGVNDFAIFGVMALTSFASGFVVTNAGWARLNALALPALVLLLGLVVWLWATGRRAAAVPGG